MEREGIELNQLADRRQELAEGGRTAVLVAIDGRAAGLVGMADDPRPTAAEGVAELRRLGTEVVMLTGANEATAKRIGELLGDTTLIADDLPREKSTTVAELQETGKKGQ